MLAALQQILEPDGSYSITIVKIKKVPLRMASLRKTSEIFSTVKILMFLLSLSIQFLPLSHIKSMVQCPNPWIGFQSQEANIVQAG